MSQPPAGIMLKTWETPQCPFSIEYAPAVMEQIRQAAMDAFFSLRGGVEIGGVLFGSVSADESSVRILAFRPIECEHARGPRFLLSGKDLERLRAQLGKSADDPVLRGMQALGWYHSHTRSEIFLCAQDLAIYNSVFPAIRQIALVVRPDGVKPTRAGFFFREGSSVHTESSYREFVLQASAFAPARPVGKEQPAPAPAPAPAAFRPAPPRIDTPCVFSFPWHWRGAIAAAFGGLLFAAALTSVESVLAARVVATTAPVVVLSLPAPVPAAPRPAQMVTEVSIDAAPSETEPAAFRTPPRRWQGWQTIAARPELPALPQAPAADLVASAQPAGVWAAPPLAAGPRRVVFEGGIITFFTESIVIADKKHPQGISLPARGVDYTCESKSRSCTIAAGGTRLRVKHAADYRMLMEYLNQARF
jgi:hypothetical protein